MQTKCYPVTMGFNRFRTGVISLTMVLMLLGALALPSLCLIGEVEAAPNPIPIVTLSLYPSMLEAKVSQGSGETVTFGGNCTVEQMSFMTNEVSFVGTVNKGWAIQISPGTLTFNNPGTKRFSVYVTVPAGIADGETANVIVTGTLELPIIEPSRGSASAVVKVVNTSPTLEWDVKIHDPQPGDTYTTDDVTIMGSASCNLGDITAVEVKVCTGPWMVATGTSEWTIDYDSAFLDDGEHSINVRARSGDEVSPTVEIVVTQDRSDQAKDVKDGQALPDDTVKESRNLYTYLLVGILIIGGLGIGYWYYNRRQRDELAYLTNYY